MTRMRMTSAVAFALLGGIVALAPVSSAEAGPADSPFTGAYAWDDGETWSVSISSKGQITGSLVYGFIYTKGSLSGRVNADGTYSFTMSVTFPTFDNPERRTHGPEFRTAHYKFAGSLSPDADGNLVGTADSGGSASFVWLRQ